MWSLFFDFVRTQSWALAFRMSWRQDKLDSRILTSNQGWMICVHEWLSPGQRYEEIIWILSEYTACVTQWFHLKGWPTSFSELSTASHSLHDLDQLPKTWLRINYMYVTLLEHCMGYKAQCRMLNHYNIFIQYCIYYITLSETHLCNTVHNYNKVTHKQMNYEVTFIYCSCVCIVLNGTCTCVFSS